MARQWWSLGGRRGLALTLVLTAVLGCNPSTASLRPVADASKDQPVVPDRLEEKKPTDAKPADPKPRPPTPADRPFTPTAWPPSELVAVVGSPHGRHGSPILALAASLDGRWL